MVDFAVGNVTVRPATTADRPTTPGIAKERVGLRIDNLEWSAWSDLSITLGIERCARSASLTLSAKDPRRQRLIRIVPGLPCEVRIGDDAGADLVITGYTDDDTINPRNGTKFTIGVRSRTEDIVDCTVEHKPGIFRKRKLERIAAELCDVYHVPVLCDVDTGPVIPLFVAKRTEKVFDALDRLSQERGLLYVDDGAGNLHITSVDPDGEVVRIIQRGRDYEELGRTRSAKERYQTYRCLGQSTSEIDAGGTATDAWMQRNRVLTFKMDKAATAKECKARAEWEATVRAGKSVQYPITVPGWRIDPGDPDSRLWRPNILVRLIDPVWEIDAVLLVAQVQFSKSVGGGTRTTLTLGSPYGYRTKPPKHKAGKRQMTDYFAGTTFDAEGFEGDGADDSGEAE